MVRRTLVLAGAVVVLAFLFLVPVIYAPPQVEFGCYSGHCNFTTPMYESVTYWAFHAGGVWMYSNYYTVIL